jgi:putative nucleotidyltransferase with HDIG domain
MRMKFPWPSWARKTAQPGAPLDLPSVVAGEGSNQRQDESLLGAEILESSNVETAELGALAKLTPFRPVVISLVRLFDRDDVKIDEIVALVESDPSTASELLAVVNSPLFAFQKNVSSPAHAIALLGVERTRSLAATLAMRSLMQDGPRTPVVRRFWMHSIATATIARHFAGVFGAKPELCYLAALMHDLGRSGLLAAYTEPYTRLALASHDSAEEILAAEQAACGMTHCHAGALLAKAWNLPEPFGEVAAHHHEDSSGHPIVALVQLCCRLADDFMYQAINRCDLRKPEETIARHAPEVLREKLIDELPAVNAAVATAIETLDF